MRRIVTMASVTVLALLASTILLWADDDFDDDSDADVESPPVASKGKSAGGAVRSGDEKKYRDFAEVTRGAEKHEGLFTLHRKDDHLYAEIRPNQFDQAFLAPIMIARGMAMAGQPLNNDDEWVVLFKRVGERVQLIRRNVHYRAPSGSPLERAVKQNYTDSVLMALPVISINNMNNHSVVIDLADIFFTNFADLGFGGLDRNRTSWHKIKTFPNNVELEVEATFTGGGRISSYFGGDDGVADRRGRTIVIHYSLAKLPEPGYRPRYADDRVGYFLSAAKDFGSNDPDTNFVRQINRWRFEKADHRAKLSPPKKQLIWYVENNVPHEYRPFVEAGILEWNKAFEKIGIRNALAVRWQEEGRDDFDPEDINYCTFRWITTNMTYAMSCLRANPLTGEMIDGDVIFDASWIRYWKQEYAFLTSTAAPGSSPSLTGDTGPWPLALGRVISPIMAAKEGYGLPFAPPSSRGTAGAEASAQGVPQVELIPGDWSSLQIQLRQRQRTGQFAGCQYSLGMRPELALAAMALAGNHEDRDREKGKDEPSEPRLPEEFLGQLIKEVVMHEVGHSLGLRHNFKASTMLDADQLNDPAITRARGMVGSVMDYNPINLVPRGRKQGDFTTTTIGPYDYWAIEYAYKPIDGDEAAELRKIAARSPEPDLIYATDEDMYLNHDPGVNTYDLGSDTLRFARDRVTLASELLAGLEDKVVKDGESWTRLRSAFSILLEQWGNAAYLAAEHIGGQSVARDHKGSHGGRDPVVPTPAAKQRAALAFVSDQILSDRAFRFSPALLRKLASERWSHWGNESSFRGDDVNYPINEEILAIQKIVLSRCLQSDVLARLANQEHAVDQGAEPLRMAEVFRALSDGIWSEITPGSAPVAEGAGGAGTGPLVLTTIRRNLQREYLRRLCTMVLGQRRGSQEDRFAFIIFSGGSSTPADARSLARMHLREIAERIDRTLAQRRAGLDDTTRAHLEECVHRINKVLDAGLDANEP
jgi:hypothetical protein